MAPCLLVTALVIVISGEWLSRACARSYRALSHGGGLLLLIMLSWTVTALAADLTLLDRTRLVNPVTLSAEGVDILVSNAAPRLDEQTESALMGVARAPEGGLGLVVRPEKGELLIERVLDQTPASRAGLTDGDLIVEVDDLPVAGRPIRDVVVQLRGKVGSPVVLAVSRPGAKEMVRVTLTRETVGKALELFAAEQILRSMFEPARRIQILPMGPETDGKWPERGRTGEADLGIRSPVQHPIPRG